MPPDLSIPVEIAPEIRAAMKAHADLIRSRVARFEFKQDDLLALMTGRFHFAPGLLPDDAQAIGLGHDFATNAVALFVRSEAYEDVLPGSLPRTMTWQKHARWIDGELHVTAEGSEFPDPRRS